MPVPLDRHICSAAMTKQMAVRMTQKITHCGRTTVMQDRYDPCLPLHRRQLAAQAGQRICRAAAGAGREHSG